MPPWSVFTWEGGEQAMLWDSKASLLRQVGPLGSAPIRWNPFKYQAFHSHFGRVKPGFDIGCAHTPSDIRGLHTKRVMLFHKIRVPQNRWHRSDQRKDTPVGLNFGGFLLHVVPFGTVSATNSIEYLVDHHPLRQMLHLLAPQARQHRTCEYFDRWATGKIDPLESTVKN